MIRLMFVHTAGPIPTARFLFRGKSFFQDRREGAGKADFGRGTGQQKDVTASKSAVLFFCFFSFARAKEKNVEKESRRGTRKDLPFNGFILILLFVLRQGFFYQKSDFEI